MKNLSGILNIVLLAAVIFLYVREFSSNSTKNEGAKTEAKNFETNDFSNLRVAYINYDSLVAHYEYHKELKTKLEAEAIAIETELARRSQQFQENVALLQQEAANLSPERLQREQQELQMIQEQILMYREEQGMKLAEQEQQLTELLRADLDKILEKVKDEYSLGMIFSFDNRSDLLIAQPDLNITETVLEQLNENYNQSKTDSIK